MSIGAPKWEGTDDYIASSDLARIVNVAVLLGRPLLIKGEPGTGKTLLASSIARGLNMELITWHVKSTTKAKDGLYVYDTVQRLYDSRFQDKDVSDIKQYIHLGPLGRSFAAPARAVLLIDEIDKADVEFPNDLLHELDAMTFDIPETGETIAAAQRPVVIITSNSEKELPDAFLRRSVFHYIEFPTEDLMSKIVQVHFPNLGAHMLQSAMNAFYRLRGVEGLRKKPSTSELIDWIGALMASGISPDSLDEEIPMLGVLLKREQDVGVAIRRLAASGKPRQGGLQR
ncbi:MAG: MoxR family ATPase [Myxococcales bacterium]|nr:MoxR family ATPase [Myxococcales bacterium]MCB9649311.1 MoxR family ATPase [Deltaproteobacteria bacterium]